MTESLRRRAAVLSFALLLALGAAPAARAVLCAADAVPAATLLLPYFEVDIANMQGANTLFSLNNASSAAVLAHVVVWSDLSVPVLDFNVYLTGYDIQTFSLFDLLMKGWMPQTASLGQDPHDTISPQGDFSQDIDFASCDTQLPLPNLPPPLVTHLQAALTGKPSALFGGLCYGLDHGDNLARGYITIDTVNNCTLLFPGDPGYFVPGGNGDATNQNVLWGDYFYASSEQGVAQGNPLVHIEASDASPETSVNGQYTFYGRYVGWTAADNREPLATGFAVRYVTGGTFDGGTDLIAWRDSKLNQGAFTCPVASGIRPAWYPLGQERVIVFDEQENTELPQSFPFSPQPPLAGIVPFPAEAQRVRVGGPALPVPFDFGWLYLNLNTTVSVVGNNPQEDPSAAQAWVTAVMTAEGRFSVGFDAIQLDSACAANHLDPDEVP